MHPRLFPKYVQLLVDLFILVSGPVFWDFFRKCLGQIGRPSLQTFVHEKEGRWFAILVQVLLRALLWRPLGSAANMLDQDVVPNSVHVRPLFIGKRALCGCHFLQ